MHLSMYYLQNHILIPMSSFISNILLLLQMVILFISIIKDFVYLGGDRERASEREWMGGIEGEATSLLNRMSNVGLYPRILRS